MTIYDYQNQTKREIEKKTFQEDILNLHLYFLCIVLFAPFELSLKNVCVLNVRRTTNKTLNKNIDKKLNKYAIFCFQIITF